MRYPTVRFLLLPVLAAAAFALPAPPVATAQEAAYRVQDPLSEEGLPDWLQRRLQRRAASRRDSSEVTDVVQPLLAEVSRATVEVWENGEPRALATVIDSDGWAVTKNSELAGGDLRVRLDDDRLIDADVVSRRRNADLALLKIDAEGLPAVQLETTQLEVGSFIVSAGVGGDVIGLGVVGTAARPIRDKGILGVAFRPSDRGMEVTGVLPRSGAAEAGVETGDLILSVNGDEIETETTLKDVIGELYPGERAELLVNRAGEEVQLKVKILDQNQLLESGSDVRVNGPRSARMAGFDSVVQHDTVLGPDQCGGPVVDLQGRVVGINIARAGRVNSYALPAETIRPLVAAMLDEAGAAEGTTELVKKSR